MKTISQRLLTYEDTDTMDANRFSIYLHGLTEKKRQHLVKLYNEGKLILHDHKDELQAVLACEAALHPPYKTTPKGEDGPPGAMTTEQAFRSMWNI